MLVTAKQAAQRLNVAVSTVHTWRSRGLITPVARGPHGTLVYQLRDLLEVERSTRRTDPTRRRARRLALEADREQ